VLFFLNYTYIKSLLAVTTHALDIGALTHSYGHLRKREINGIL
jgi:hypothetical protein